MPDSTTLVVTEVTRNGNNATFQFEDGHRVTFEGYCPYGTPADLYRFILDNGVTWVVQYDARLFPNPIEGMEHRFVRVAEGYTVELIVAYWEAARRYINNEYVVKPRQERRVAPSNLWFPNTVAHEGWGDLHAIKNGQKPFPDQAKAGGIQ